MDEDACIERSRDTDYSQFRKRLLMVNILQDRPKLCYDSRRTKHAPGCTLLACNDIFRGTTHILNNHLSL